MREQPAAPTPTSAGAAAEPQRADPLAVIVATAVADLRRAKGLSERAAARLLRTSQTQLRRMEDPRYLPSLRSLSRLAAAYGYRLSVEFKPLSARPAPSPGLGPTAEQPKRRAERARPSEPAAPAKGRRARGAARARPRRATRRRRR